MLNDLIKQCQDLLNISEKHAVIQDCCVNIDECIFQVESSSNSMEREYYKELAYDYAHILANMAKVEAIQHLLDHARIYELEEKANK